jgi:3-keto-5-aminohexanoate cleavage enzyme
MSKVIVTCALNGVLTDPTRHSVPVSPAEMAAEARRAFDAGACVMHIHLRQQGEGRGHLPSWDIALSRDVQAAIRGGCPGVIINHTTGMVGPEYLAALDVVTETRPEMAACNAGSLNYLKLRRDGTWAWPPMLFDNTPQKVQHFIDAITGVGAIPEFECFDTGIVRSVGMYRANGMFSGTAQINFVMGVASGMPARADLLPILRDLAPEDSSLAGHRDRPGGDLAAAPQRGGTGRAHADGAGGYVLPAGRREGPLEWSAGRGNRPDRARGRPRCRLPGRGARDPGAAAGLRRRRRECPVCTARFPPAPTRSARTATA